MRPRAHVILPLSAAYRIRNYISNNPGAAARSIAKHVPSHKSPFTLARRSFVRVFFGVTSFFPFDTFHARARTHIHANTHDTCPAAPYAHPHPFLAHIPWPCVATLNSSEIQGGSAPAHTATRSARFARNVPRECRTLRDYPAGRINNHSRTNPREKPRSKIPAYNFSHISRMCRSLLTRDMCTQKGFAANPGDKPARPELVSM